MREVWLVAWFDLRESLRSKKAVSLMVIYLIGSMAATGIFVSVLAEIESTVADTLAVSQTAQPGAMTNALMESSQVLDILAGLIGDRDLASKLVSIPPVALFYSWLSLTFVPLLITFTSAEAISQPLARGSIRFSLFRTTRMRWCSGMFLGQALLMGAGVLLGALGVWVVACFSLNSFEAGRTGLWLLRFSGRACIYGFTFLGATLGISQISRSVNASRALALAALIGLGLGGALTSAPAIIEHAPVLINTLNPLFPNAHRLDLWRPDLISRLPATTMLLAMGVTFFAMGHMAMMRRDA